MIRIGFVGIDGIEQWLGAFANEPNATLVGVAERGLEPTYNVVRAYLGIDEVYRDVATMVAQARPDALVICLPSHRRVDVTIGALRRGLHVLCVGPVTRRARAVLTAADEARRLLQIGGVYPYQTRYALQSVLEGRFGPVRTIRAQWLMRGIPEDPALWKHPRVGVETDLLPSLLSVVLPLVGRPLWVTAHGWSDAGRRLYGERFKARDTFEVRAGFEQDVEASCHVEWMASVENDLASLEVWTEGGTFFIPLMTPAEAHGDPLEYVPFVSYWAFGVTLVDVLMEASPVRLDHCLAWQAHRFLTGCQHGRGPTFAARRELMVPYIIAAAQRSDRRTGGYKVPVVFD